MISVLSGEVSGGENGVRWYLEMGSPTFGELRKGIRTVERRWDHGFCAWGSARVVNCLFALFLPDSVRVELNSEVTPTKDERHLSSIQHQISSTEVSISTSRCPQGLSLENPLSFSAPQCHTNNQHLLLKGKDHHDVCWKTPSLRRNSLTSQNVLLAHALRLNTYATLMPTCLCFTARPSADPIREPPTDEVKFSSSKRNGSAFR